MSSLRSGVDWNTVDIDWAGRGWDRGLRGIAFDGEVVSSQVAGGVWSLRVAVGDEVADGQALVVVESMKMEITVQAPRAGRVARLLCAEGQAVGAGQPLVLLE